MEEDIRKKRKDEKVCKEIQGGKWYEGEDEEVALGQDCFPVILFSPVSIIPPLLLTYIHHSCSAV